MRLFCLFSVFCILVFFKPSNAMATNCFLIPIWESKIQSCDLNLNANCVAISQWQQLISDCIAEETPENADSEIPALDAPADIIIDHQDSRVSFEGVWKPRLVESFSESFSKEASSIDGLDKARFTPTFVQDGVYEVLIWNACSSKRSSRVPYTIKHLIATETVYVDQNCSSGVHDQWHSLGAYAFSGNAEHFVEVTHDPKAGTSSIIGVDAIQFRWSTQGAAPAIQLAERQLEVVQGQTVQLSAQAFDYEDGDISAQLVWRDSGSDLKVVGDSVSYIPVLGHSVLTLTIKDSDGLSASDDIWVNAVAASTLESAEEQTNEPAESSDSAAEHNPEPQPESTPAPVPSPTATPVPTVEPTPLPATPIPATPEPVPSVLPEPAPEPSISDEVSIPPTPVPVSSSPRAMYAYVNDINEAKPLKGAQLEPRVVYLFWLADDASQVKFYCCKGLSGDARGERHSDISPLMNPSQPFAIDFRTYTSSGTRELYVDYIDNEGRDRLGYFTNFSINIAMDTGSEDELVADTPDAVSTPEATPAPVYKQVDIKWSAPSTREDGSPLSLTEIDEYLIVYTELSTGKVDVIAIDDPQVTQYTLSGLSVGEYAFHLKTYDSDGVSSRPSQSVTLVVK